MTAFFKDLGAIPLKCCHLEDNTLISQSLWEIRASSPTPRFHPYHEDKSLLFLWEGQLTNTSDLWSAPSTPALRKFSHPLIQRSWVQTAFWFLCPIAIAFYYIFLPDFAHCHFCFDSTQAHALESQKNVYLGKFQNTGGTCAKSLDFNE